MNIGIDEFKQERLQAIIDDKHSGATELGRLALHALADFTQVCVLNEADAYKNELLNFGMALQQSRASIAPLYNLVGSWCQWLEAEKESNLTSLREIAFNTALDQIYQSEQASTKIAAHVYELINEDSVVFTHSVSSTVLSCFQALVDKSIKAIITQAAPSNGGERIADFLAKLAISADYITDAQMGIFISKADVVLVGADTILADGVIVNNAGTYLLALAAREAQVPFYVCAESVKNSSLTMEAAYLEEMDGAELNLPKFPHISPRNIYFDITPGNLITAWVNEHGVQKRD